MEPSVDNPQRPDPSELPSTGKLLRSTGIAAAVAAVLLTLVILPAEYGIDLTGVGRLLGLTQMGQIKVALAKEAEAAKPAGATTPSPVAAAAPAEFVPVIPAPATGRRDEMSVTLAPDEATEIKLDMRQGDKARFVWSTNGPRVNFDTHGDGSGRDYHGYGKGTDTRQEGELTAAFDGRHGWFWRNRSGQPVTITLKVEGAHTGIERLM